MTKKGTAILAILISLVLGGCAPAASAPAASAPTGLTIERVWARPSTMADGGMSSMQASTSAVYLTIKNGAAADRLTAARGTIAKSVEIHQTTMEGGNAKMSPVSAIEIPANGQIELKPGGYHIMLVEPVHELKAGDAFSIVLVFDRAGEVTVPVAVQPNT